MLGLLEMYCLSELLKLLVASVCGAATFISWAERSSRWLRVRHLLGIPQGTVFRLLNALKKWPIVYRIAYKWCGTELVVFASSLSIFEPIENTASQFLLFSLSHSNDTSYSTPPAQGRTMKLLRKHISPGKLGGLCMFYLVFKYYKCRCERVLLILTPSPVHCSINNKCNNML